MFGFLKNLLRRSPGDASDNNEAEYQSSSSNPAPDYYSNTATAQPRHQNGRNIELPLQKILESLPLELQPRVRQPDAGSLTVSVPLEKILAQLSRGVVKVSFGELRQAVPGVFTAENDRDRVMVALPLSEILSRLNPALITRRRAQHQVHVPAEIASPFDPNGGYTPVTEAEPAPATAPARFNTPAPGAPASLNRGAISSVSTPPPPALPASRLKAAPAAPAAPVQPSPAAPAPEAHAPVLPAAPIRFTPPARPGSTPPAVPGASAAAPARIHRPTPPPPAAAPASTAAAAPVVPPAPAVSRPPVALPGLAKHAPTTDTKFHKAADTKFHKPSDTKFHKAPVAAEAAPKQPAPKPAAPAPAAPVAAAAATPAAKAAPAGEPVVLPLASLAEAWPEAVRKELVEFKLVDSQVALPVAAIEQGLKQGRIAFSWKTIRSWLKPAVLASVSTHDSTVLELPLKAVAPVFLARQKETAKPHEKVAVDEDIPNLFFGQPQSETPAPVAVTAPRPADTNFYVWGDSSDTVMVHESEVKRGSSPGTQFVAKYATPNEIVSRAAALDGVAGALIALPDGLMVANQLPTELNGDTLAAFLPQIFGKVSQCTKELRMGELNNLNFTVGNVPWKIFRVNAIFFAAFGRPGEPLPTGQLAALAAELDHKPK